MNTETSSLTDTAEKEAEKKKEKKNRIHDKMRANSVI